MGHDGLVVVKKAASKRHQNRGERRQKGDHTHYETPKRETTDALPNHSLVRLVVAKLQQKAVKSGGLGERQRKPRTRGGWPSGSAISPSGFLLRC